MRYTGPKNRLARREGMDLALKTAGSKAQARLLKKLNVAPGQHGSRGRRKVSDYGKQLREKQKLRYMFGLSAKQLKNYYTKAIKKPGNTALFLAEYLERRLDNTVYRLGLAPTRACARQLIVHGHIKVDDRLMTVPSHQLEKGNVLSFAKPSSVKIPAVEKALETKDVLLPAWLEKKAASGRMTGDPNGDFIEKQIKMRLVIEFFSR
ncbi:30S ribosomal protein S4 [Patescibacteria group bacterium]|nr:30S ribosomal protein S4 [Patescibacteria group bacterium]MCL5091696.1 30S ribosomal protein S4 [Patescibacteria group bacterium]